MCCQDQYFLISLHHGAVNVFGLINLSSLLRHEGVLSLRQVIQKTRRYLCLGWPTVLLPVSQIIHHDVPGVCSEDSRLRRK